MHRESHNRYDVRAWLNKDDEVEVKVYDHQHHRFIAHLVEKDTDEPTEGDVFASIWYECYQQLERGDEEITLKFFEEIDREAPEYSENTLYWNLDSDSFGWARHPLHSWRSSAASGEFVAFENLYRDELLERAFDGLRQQYMEDAEKEMLPQ
jgi:hypothetical protein